MSEADNEYRSSFAKKTPTRTTTLLGNDAKAEKYRHRLLGKGENPKPLVSND